MIAVKPARKNGHRYPWGKWFAQPDFVLVRGRHFDCEPFAMGMMVRQAARRQRPRRWVEVKVRGNEVDVKVLSAPGPRALAQGIRDA